ncbi:VirB4 family type IV secretion/conjugal transfer ATPase [Parasphingorhabdus flavimaris]|uniref:Type IV secretion system protein virB4 n=1 Tax=Parasphingorhabdus flavimaris TaxID=266812 RepID=A0ABX2N2R8_9SPHN|nr:VirB4 family type IV secretion/conjugal transfer ATPase [Parasphingorhabdus flavimaris]NVD28011.1 VirB4 family type IV secretion/conjugal transfer ATPase [Parasphingorhabdus flavimaris]|tara:strand:- start:585 stop:2978 length:2394 start_codon:yes stop_codon:yes gene_type:complete
MGRLLATKNAVPLKIAQRETTPEKFLPYARHINDQMVALDSGDIMLTFELTGRAFETSDVRDLNDWHTKINGLLRNLHDERLSIWTHLIRMRVDQYPGGAFKSGFAADLDLAYFGRINRERMFINRFFVSLVIRPSATGSDKIIQLFKRKVSKQADKGPLIDEALVELLDDKARDFEKLMARCQPRRCGIYEHRGLMFSETMEVANMVMTGRHVRVPVVRGHLGGALYRARTIFGSETIEVRGADTSAFGGIFGIREYPAQTTPRQFEALLSVDFGFVLTQSFTFLGRAAATEKFRLRMTQMENSGDRAVSQADALIDASDDLMSNRFVLGDHHFTLAVYGTNMRALRDHMSVARAALADTGMVAAREGAALEAAYWSQLVGNFAWRARPAPITSLNFAAFSPFHTFPAGQANGNHWDEAIALLKTSARSPYFFNFHKGDLGHTLIIGPSGGGKTVLLNFLMAQAEKTGARQIFIDKDRGAQIFVQASGGTYLALHNGIATGFSPLKALTDCATDKSFLSIFIRQLVRADGKPISVQEERRIEDGINAVMKLPIGDRSLSALRSMLGMKDASGVGARLEKWTSEGSLGWVFDNAHDSMTLDARFVGFDMTDFLDNADIRTPIMLYLFHRIDQLLTGERMIICIDEFWKALGDEAFRRFAQDGLKTYRKRNALMVFATQSPADALKSDISHSILEQVATKVMLPNPFGARGDYVDGFALSEAEFKLVREDLSPESHKFLVKQGHDSVVVELDLSGLDDALAVLSGRAETTAQVDEIIAEAGSDPAIWLPLFHSRRRPS